jgi:hypothetical protein
VIKVAIRFILGFDLILSYEPTCTNLPNTFERSFRTRVAGSACKLASVGVGRGRFFMVDAVDR